MGGVVAARDESGYIRRVPHLAHTVLAPKSQQRHDVWFLHGILGSGRNWRSFGRRLQARVSGVRVVLVDLRAHGDSAAMPGPATVAQCVNDLRDLAALLGTPNVVCGHSFGGKVALRLAASAPQGLAEVWSLDSPPGTGPTVPGEIDQVLRAVRSFGLPIADRETVAAGLKDRGFSAGLAGWMTTNLRSHEGPGLVWRFDVDAVAALLADYFTVDAWPILEAVDLPVARRVLRAARSQRFSSDDMARLRSAAEAGTCTADVLPDAGHWLHVDNADGLLNWMQGWLDARPIDLGERAL